MKSRDLWAKRETAIVDALNRLRSRMPAGPWTFSAAAIAREIPPTCDAWTPEQHLELATWVQRAGRRMFEAWRGRRFEALGRCTVEYDGGLFRVEF